MAASPIGVSSMIYLASPYSSPLPTVQEDRYKLAVAFTLECLREGVNVFSPIAYFHSFAQVGGLPTDAGYWHNTNMSYLRKADAVFCLRLAGWEQSKGVTVELNTARILNIPVVHYGPDFKVVQ